MIYTKIIFSKILITVIVVIKNKEKSPIYFKICISSKICTLAAIIFCVNLVRVDFFKPFFRLIYQTICTTYFVKLTVIFVVSSYGSFQNTYILYTYLLVLALCNIH